MLPGQHKLQEDSYDRGNEVVKELEDAPSPSPGSLYSGFGKGGDDTFRGRDQFRDPSLRGSPGCILNDAPYKSQWGFFFSSSEDSDSENESSEEYFGNSEASDENSDTSLENSDAEGLGKDNEGL